MAVLSVGVSLLLRNALLLDPTEGSYVEGDIRCAGGRIVEVGTGLTAPDARTEDLRGAVVMPGLVDAHVHVTALTADLGSIPALSPSYVAAHSARVMGQMLDRGFTTVRDVAGADYGLADAQAEGLLRAHDCCSAGGRSARPEGTATAAAAALTATTTTPAAQA